MKVLIINGSPHTDGTTARAIAEMCGIFEKEGVELNVMNVGNIPMRGCMSCGYCRKGGEGCVLGDEVNRAAELFREADGLVVASPVHYASPGGNIIAFLDRLFYSTTFDKTMKIGAAVVCARRGGCTASFDVLNKYFTISGMPVAASSYWNQLHGAVAADAEEDLEGLATLRNLAKNMTFLMRSVALGKEKFGLPEKEPKARTNFIKR